MVRIHHRDGTETELDSGEFSSYVEQPGDVFDFDDFDAYPSNASLIDQVFAELKSAIAMDGAGNVVILTARSNPKPVREFLSDSGIDGIEIVTTGTSNPMAKARYILDRVNNGTFDEVRVFEDNAQNIRTIRKVIEPTGVRLQSNRVTARGVIREGLVRPSVYSLWDLSDV
jgi:hypothetical protein